MSLHKGFQSDEMPKAWWFPSFYTKQYIYEEMLGRKDVWGILASDRLKHSLRTCLVFVEIPFWFDVPSHTHPWSPLVSQPLPYGYFMLPRAEGRSAGWPGPLNILVGVPYGASQCWTCSWLSRRCLCKTCLQLISLSKILRSWDSHRTCLVSVLPSFFLSPFYCLFSLLMHAHRQLILFSCLGREALARCLVVISCWWTTFSSSSC